MKKAYYIINRELSPSPSTGADTWVHLAPLGDFPGTLVTSDGEKSIIQRIDRAALDAIVRNFEPKVLVDLEHRSMFPRGDTAAAAWILALEIRPDGLWGRLDLSDIGEGAIKNKRYRHLSPAFDVEPVGTGDDGIDIVRPVRLTSAGLTNNHNLKALQPLTNSAAAESNEKKEHAMKEIAIALGLPETADLPAILSAIAALKTAQTELEPAKAKIKELEGSALEKEADVFVAANSAKIKDAPAVKKQYVVNKDATIALFASLADAPLARAARVHNQAAATTPGAGAVDTDVDKAKAQKAFVLQIQAREKCDYKTAWNIARMEKPELFKEEAKAD